MYWLVVRSQLILEFASSQLNGAEECPWFEISRIYRLATFLRRLPSAQRWNGAAICLVIAVDADTVSARAVTTHWNLVFDRNTLTGRRGNGQPDFFVRSTESLPEHIRKVLLELDRKFDPGIWDGNLEDAKLTAAEKEALLFVADHYHYPEDRQIENTLVHNGFVAPD